jgi:hypothetical protein
MDFEVNIVDVIERPDGPKPPARSHLELYKVYRRYCESENSLTNHRLTWLFTIHGFLFAAYAFCLQGTSTLLTGANPFPQSGMLPFTVNSLAFVRFIISVTGIAVSVLTWPATIAAQLAVGKLNRKWKGIVLLRKQADRELGISTFELPGLLGGGNPWAHVLGMVPPYFLPLAFALIWFWIWEHKF